MDNKVFPENISFTFITGGIRSGKSDYAQKLAESMSHCRLYLATAVVSDKSMELRVEKHKKKRDETWKVLELPLGFGVLTNPFFLNKNYEDACVQIKKYFLPYVSPKTVILLDCLTLWISGCIDSFEDEIAFAEVCKKFLLGIGSLGCPIVVVSNEIGLGGIPLTSIGRKFCDFVGTANKVVATMANNVVFIASGLPIVVKGKIPR